MLMNVLLRHFPSGFCYGGRGCWVNDPERALDLRTIEGATLAAKAEDFGGMEIVVGFGDPDCEFVLLLRPYGKRGYRAAAVRFQAVAVQAPASLTTVTRPIPPPSGSPGMT